MGQFAAPLSIGTGMLGSILSTIGGIGGANSQADAAAYQGQVAHNNSLIASQNAEAATQAGQVKATDTSLKGRAQLGAAISGVAASGIDPNSGSAADVQTTDREFNKLDTLTTANNAALAAYGYRTAAANYAADAALDTATSENAAAAAPIGAVGSLVAGASSIGDKWVKFQQDGVPGFGTGAKNGVVDGNMGLG